MKAKRVFSIARQLIILFVLVLALLLSSCNQKGDVALYSNPENNTFLKTWMLLGPVFVADSTESPDMNIQKEAFENDVLDPSSITSLSSLSSISVEGQAYSWALHSSEFDVVDLNAVFDNREYAYAYAYAEIEMQEAQTILYGLGSDDAVKLWLNGKEVHNEFIGRALSKDDDLFELNLNKGRNQLLLKIQNFTLGWEFCIRPIGVELVSELVCSFAGKGDLDDINELLKYKPDLNYKSESGLTAWQNAKVNGRLEVVDLLVANGAKEDHNFPELSNYIDDYIQYNLEDSTPGLAVLIAQNGKVLFEKGYGFANIEGEVKVDTKTKFRIGSVTKQFIATGILMLQEEGKLNVQDKLSKYIPEFPRGDEVSIHHLLTHTSGILSFTGRPDFMEEVVNKVEPQTVIDSIMTWEYTFDPGDEILYNNSGYFILGQIIEIVSGKWYGEYLSDEIFIPLKMNNTGVYVNETPPEHEAIGYTYEGGHYVSAVDWNMSWAGGAGALYSTVEDLFIWNEALFNGHVLSEESMKAAHSPVRLNDGEIAQSMSYGYGWGIRKFRGEQEISHSGGLHGFISNLSRIPNENLTIVALTNTTPTMEGLMPGEVTSIACEYALWKKLTPQKSYATKAVNAITLKDYAGRYDYGNSMVLVVSVEDNKLFAQMSGQPKHELFAGNADEFFWKVVEADIKFVRNDGGMVNGAVHFQGGSELEVSKLPELVTVPMDKTEIEPYIGDYKFQEGFIITLSTNGEGKLFIEATNQPKVEFFRTDDKTYEARATGIKVRLVPISGIVQIEIEQGFTKTVIDKME